MDIQYEYMITDGENYASNNTASSLGSRQDAFIWKNETSARNVLNQAQIRKKLPLTFAYHIESIPVYHVELDSDVERMANIILQFTSLYRSLTESKKDLSKQLSVVDRQLSDFSHFIEMKSVNARDACKVYKEFQRLRLLRRNIKDKLALTNALLVLSYDSISSIESDALKLMTKTYTPREIDFDSIV